MVVSVGGRRPQPAAGDERAGQSAGTLLCVHPLHGVRDVLARQDGVVARRQLLAAGLAHHDVARLVRRRDLTLVGRGVMVDHTGPLTPRQRVWVPLVALAPAAASHATALALCGLGVPPEHDLVHVSIDARRRALSLPGVVVHRRRSLDQVTAWHLTPPRVRLEESLLDVALTRVRRLDGVADLADAVGARRTTAPRLREALSHRARVPDRRWWADVVEDLAGGTHSVLEHGYLARVERPHGLPTGERQVVTVVRGRRAYQDLRYDPWGLRVELDGVATHASRRQRERDLDRDVLGNLAGEHTLRLGWGHVFERPCWTAGAVGRLLARLGWREDPRRCSAACVAMAPSA